MSKHTPGPWILRQSKFGELCIHAPSVEAIVGLDYIVVGDVNGDETKEPKYGTPSANAQLIAAAPEMLAMLINVRTSLACFPPAFFNDLTHLTALDKLIAKATGDVT